MCPLLYPNSSTSQLPNILTYYNYTNGNLLSSSYAYTSPSTSISYTNDASENPQYKYVTVGSTTVMTSYNFGVLNRLYRINIGSAYVGSYGYDGLNRRVVSVESGAVTYYAYLGTNVLYSFTGSIPTDYVFANGLLIAKVVSGGSPNYYQSDILGSTRLVTDSANSVNVLFSNGYQPFGQDNGRASGSETYKFTGKPYSSTTGLYYDYQRWYDNSTGRFISQDPLPGHLRIPQSLNAFAYVLNQPTRLVDPTGLSWGCFGEEDCGGGASGAGSGSTGSNSITRNDLASVDVSSNDLPTNTLTPEQASTFGRGASPTEDINNIGKFLDNVETNLGGSDSGSQSKYQLPDPLRMSDLEKMPQGARISGDRLPDIKSAWVGPGGTLEITNEGWRIYNEEGNAFSQIRMDEAVHGSWQDPHWAIERYMSGRLTLKIHFYLDWP